MQETDSIRIGQEQLHEKQLGSEHAGCRPPPVSACIQAVVQSTNVHRDDIMSARRSRAISRARMMVCWVARHATPLSSSQIGACLKLDHSSVLKGIQRIDELRQSVPFIKDASDNALRLALADPRQLEIAV